MIHSLASRLESLTADNGKNCGDQTQREGCGDGSVGL